MSREDELYKLCHNATKISINNEMFSVDGCCEECVWLYGDESGEESILYFADMVEDEKNGDSFEFYSLHKMEDRPKGKRKRYISNKEWLELFWNEVNSFRIGFNKFYVLRVLDKSVVAAKAEYLYYPLQREDMQKIHITYKELREHYRKGNLKLYKEEEIEL